MKHRFVSVGIALLATVAVARGSILHGVSYHGDTLWIAVLHDSLVNALYSPDRGTTWYSRNALASGQVKPMWDLDFVNGTTGWLAGDVSFVFYTEDAGQSWTLQNYGGSKYITRIRMLNDQVGWAAAGDKIWFRTTDGGQTWQWYLVLEGRMTDFYGVAPISADECFMAGGIPFGVDGGQGMIFHTTDGGQTWDLLRDDSTYDYLDTWFVDGQTGWVVGGTDTGNYEPIILHTTDGGQTWQDQTPPVGHTLRAVQFVSATEGWAVGKFGTILHTTDGGQTWQLQPAPTQVTLFDLDFQDALHGAAVGDSSVLLLTDDGGQTWQRLTVEVAEARPWPGAAGTGPRTLWVRQGRLELPAGQWTAYSAEGRKLFTLRVPAGSRVPWPALLPEGLYFLKQPGRTLRVMVLR